MSNTDDQLEDKMSELMTRESAPPEQLRRKILILSTPRSGSSFFCDVLNKSANLGECAEWFNWRYLAAYQRILNANAFNVDQYVKKLVMAKSLRGSDTFVVNVHAGNYIWLKDTHAIDILDYGFDEIFFLTRKQKLKQAISLANATVSDQWSAGQSDAQGAVPRVSVELIAQALADILRWESYYRKHLQHLVAHEFCYETFQDLSATDGFKKLFALLGLDSDVEFRTDMIRQSSETADDMTAAFMAMLQGSMQ